MDIKVFIKEWVNEQDCIEVKTSGSTGIPNISQNCELNNTNFLSLSLYVGYISRSCFTTTWISFILIIVVPINLRLSFALYNRQTYCSNNNF
jgi:hypothetical protein